ncbi:hypothetical protein BDQ17DRAFT_1397967 [Cyathus striatus]|nr:hypothetical protein BDQ17DRAFT_1397967 [Cyathus striatus]
MSLRYFNRQNVLDAVTTSPFTTNFRHLLPIPTKWLMERDRKMKRVQVKDRIKHWNIVPGDQIRILGDKKNTLREVLSINRMTNRVYVKGPTVEAVEGQTPKNKNFHYSRCQLFIGNYEFPSKNSSDEPKVLPVFAQRVGTSSPFWNRFFHRFQWMRYKFLGQYPRRNYIPNYDTLKEEVARVTYTPPSFPISFDGVIPRPPAEEDYLTVLYNRGKVDSSIIPKSAPVEVFLLNELSNPHSRAKKLKRWKQRQFQEKGLFKEIVEEELAQTNGRTEREARAEAAFRWRQHLGAKKQEMRKQRWKHKATAAKSEKKNARKERKEIKQRKRLAELVLKEQPNQYIPPDLRVAL